MTREEERDVIDRVLAGDANAYEDLVLANQRKIYNLCLRMTGNAEDAYDLSQESFIKAYNNLAGFKGESSFSMWLYRLSSNVCIDFLRREKRREKSSLTYQDESGAAVELELPDERFMPETELERRELRERIERGLAALSEEHRHILVLREINGLSYDEIAQGLGLSPGTVKSRISRARQNLIQFLSADGNFPAERSSIKKNQERGGVQNGKL